MKANRGDERRFLILKITAHEVQDFEVIIPLSASQTYESNGLRIECLERYPEETRNEMVELFDDLVPYQQDQVISLIRQLRRV